MNKIPRIIHTADWHFGHRSVPTADTIAVLEKYLFPQLPEADILVIAGDIFDGIISFNHTDSNRSINFFADLIMLCYEHGVVIRIVRGTFSHDYNQLTMIDQLYKKLQLPVDFRLFTEISVEIHTSGLSFLYIPDNLPFITKEDIFDHIRNLMMTSNLTKVDYVIMHGEFAQDGLGHGNIVYAIEEFEPICQQLVLSGHIHKPQHYKQLVYSGSVNRLAHGEEEAKGFWIIEGSSASFITNFDATLFITKDYRAMTQFDVLLAQHIEFMKIFGTEKQGFLRLLVADSNIKNALINYHIPHHPNVKLIFGKGTKTNVKASEYLNDKLSKQRSLVFEIPSEKNITSIVYNHLAAKDIILNTTMIETIING